LGVGDFPEHRGPSSTIWLSFIPVKGLQNDHVISHYEWNTGSIQMGFPSVGAWATYGLGSENQSLPGFVVILDQKGGPYAGPPTGRTISSAAYQGTFFRSKGNPILRFVSGRANTMTLEQQRARLEPDERAQQSFDDHTPDIGLSARILFVRLAYACRPAHRRPLTFPRKATRPSSLRHQRSGHGILRRQCLLARRLVERGVRFISL